MGLWPPKKKPLYTPMLATFGGGSSRGFNPGSSRTPDVDVTIANGWSDTAGVFNSGTGSTLSSNFSFFTIGAGANELSSQASFNMITDGIYRFTLPAGTYEYTIRGGDGSGQAHYQGCEFSGTLTTNTTLTALAAPANHGTGPYSGGGASVLVLSNSNNVTNPNISTSEVALVAGGGGGGYSGNSVDLAPTAPSTSSTQNRLGANINNGNSYDGAASIFANYTPYVHNSGNARPEHFTQGWFGGYNADCGSNVKGGFGGGGGACPAGGGGYPGGRPGTNTATTNGLANANDNATGGGSGRSFYNVNNNAWTATVNSTTLGTLQNISYSAGNTSTPNANRNAAAQGFITLTGFTS